MNLFECVVLIAALSALALGFDICGDPANDPPQKIEQYQQGKQFDHIPFNPITLKSNTLFNLYVCTADLC